MASITDFAAKFKGGVRSNLFKINITCPGISFVDLDFLATASSLPEQTLGKIEVPFRGRKLQVPGDRTFEDWTVSIINDVEFSARTALEAWQRDIQELDSGEGLTSLDYLLDRAFVEQLNKDDTVLARYEFFNMFPKNIGEITLGYDTVDAVEEFTVDLTFSHWERVL